MLGRRSNDRSADCGYNVETMTKLKLHPNDAPLIRISVWSTKTGDAYVAQGLIGSQSLIGKLRKLRWIDTSHLAVMTRY